jgi:hypothetical protein
MSHVRQGNPVRESTARKIAIALTTTGTVPGAAVVLDD